MRPVQITMFVARRVPHRRIDGLCFGVPTSRHSGHGQNPVVYGFRPGQLFGVVWLRRYPDGRQHRSLAIVQALARGDARHGLKGIRGPVTVHAIVDQHGPAGQDGAVDQMLDLIQIWKSRGHPPERLPPAYWTRASHHILMNATWLTSWTGHSVPCKT